MKPWIKKSLIGLASVTVLLGGLTACGSRGHHGEGWSAERVSEVRGKVVDKISGKLDLDEAQKQKLATLADQIIASRTAFRGDSADPRVQGLDRWREIRSQRSASLAGPENPGHSRQRTADHQCAGRFLRQPEPRATETGPRAAGEARAWLVGPRLMRPKGAWHVFRSITLVSVDP